jgi:hypothetical protein
MAQPGKGTLGSPRQLVRVDEKKLPVHVRRV